MILVRRLLVLLAAVPLLAAIVVSAEGARPEVSPIGEALHIAAPDVRMTAISDAMILRNAAPSSDDRAFVRSSAVAEPLSPLPFYILGASAQVRDPAEAIMAAMRRDPRFVPGYRWQATQDAKAGDIAGATHALLRLVVLNGRDPRILAAVAQITADPAARAVIKQEIARGAPWRDSYLAALGGSSVDRAVVFEMLQSAGRHGDVTTAARRPDQPVDDRLAFIAAMVARKDYERAYLAWVQWLPAASQAGVGHVFDGQFKGLAALPPFTWALSDGVGGATAIDPRSGLTLDYSGTDGAVVAQQMVLLTPGHYRISTEARFDMVANENGAPPLVWSLACVDATQPLGELALPLDGTSRRVASAAIVVPTNCAAQTLALRVNSADFGKRLSGQIRAVSIEAMP